MESDFGRPLVGAFARLLAAWADQKRIMASSDRSFGFFDHRLQGGYLPKEFHSRLCGTAEQHCTGGYIGNHPCRGTDLGTLTDVWTGRSGRSRCGQQRMFSETRSAQGDMLIRCIIARIRPRRLRYGGRAGKMEPADRHRGRQQRGRHFWFRCMCSPLTSCRRNHI
jgi:hypothetical protein